MSQEPHLKSLSEEDRSKYLENNCEFSEVIRYPKTLTEEEIIDAKNSVTENCIKLSDLADELKAIKKDYKEKMDPYALENKLLLTEIRSRQRIVEGLAYSLPNYKSGYMEIYNSKGELIDTRLLKDNEKQGKLFVVAQGS